MPWLDRQWIAAKSTYNYMMKDPLLDWLKFHHDSLARRQIKYSGLVKRSLQSQNSPFNFTRYIMEQGNIFERKIMKMIIKRFGRGRVYHVTGDSRDPARWQETIDMMKEGYPIIYSGILHNPTNKTFGVPDLLVRSDWLKYLVDNSPISDEEAKIGCKFSDSWHYRIVDIKFTGLQLRADATHLLNAASFPAYKAQLLIYNWALAQSQGYEPKQVYILGRRWRYISKGETYVNNSCFDKLGIIDYSTIDNSYVDQTNNAIQWVRDVADPAAANWNILNYPLSRPELYPNMSNSHDYPWHSVKEEIANQTKELTSLWMVGPANRNYALAAGVSQWTDINCNASVLDVNGEKRGKILQSIIDVNRQYQLDSIGLIKPDIIENNIGDWKSTPTIEFFVDFETTNSVINTIRHLPKAASEMMIFMIGVGYVDPITKQWIHRDFVADRLYKNYEAKICNDFSKFVLETAAAHGVTNPRCIHWSNAEDTMWTDAVERHSLISNQWQSSDWSWLDLLAIFKETPILIAGCFAFGLKEVAGIMKQHGFIQTAWSKDGDCIDGQTAMIAAKKAMDEAKKHHSTLTNNPVMLDIMKYNRVDVRVMYEIITYLRNNHTVGKGSKRRTTRSTLSNFELSPAPKRLKSVDNPNTTTPTIGQIPKMQ